tara:strand:- start:191 stop:484 length:294 start_codon:yes stop_codon:yes gene_type:complete
MGRSLLWLAKRQLIWQNLRNESLEGKGPVDADAVFLRDSLPEDIQQWRPDMFWDLLKIVFVTGVFLGLLRLHDRLRSLERKVEDIEGAAGKNEAEDE